MNLRNRFASLALIASSLVLTSCGDVLNPEFAGQIGLDPVPAASRQTGYVILMLNNVTNAATTLTWSADVKIAGSDTPRLEGGTMFIGLRGPFAQSLPCGITQLRLESLTAGPVDLALPTTLFSPPALQCGSVVAVTVSGVAPNFQVNVQLVN
jgi:hypothetical protein